MTTLPQKLAELRAKAEAATPGPWERSSTHVYRPGEDGANVCSASDPRASRMVEYREADIGSDGLRQAADNAEFIRIANPATVLALLAVVEAAQEAHEDCQQAANHRANPRHAGSCQVCDALSNLARNL